MTTDAVGGVWTYTLELVEALAAHDVEVTVVIMGPRPTGSQRRALAASAVHEVCELPVALEWMDGPWSEVDGAGAELLALAERVGADVVHLNGFVHASLA